MWTFSVNTLEKLVPHKRYIGRDIKAEQIERTPPTTRGCAFVGTVMGWR